MLGIAVAYMGFANLYMALGGFVVLIVFYYKWIMKEK